MSDMRLAPSSQTPNRSTSDGGYVAARAWRDGSLATVDFLSVMAVEGRLFAMSVGVATTPITGQVGFTTTTPDVVVDVPANSLIIPVSIRVYLEAATGTVTEIMFQSSTAATGGTPTAITPLCTRTDRPRASVVTAGRTVSGGTAGAGVVELFHDGTPIAAAAGIANTYQWDWKMGVHIIGSSGASHSLQGFVGATTTAATYFAKLVWVELPTSALL